MSRTRSFAISVLTISLMAIVAACAGSRGETAIAAPAADRLARDNLASAAIPGDVDGDGDLDLADHGQVPGCLTGPAEVPPDGDCAVFDLEGDGDVDLLDYALLSRLGLVIDCGMTATASSVENGDPGLGAQMAVDGNFATRWASAFADSQWLEVDLGRDRSVHGLTIYWEDAYASSFDVHAERRHDRD